MLSSCCRCGVVVVIEVERCVDGSALALRMGGATVPFARNVERYARMPDLEPEHEVKKIYTKPTAVV